MNFGTKLKLKKDWEYDDYITFQKGDILQVVFGTKYGLKLYYPLVGNLLDFAFNTSDKEERLSEFFEVLDENEELECPLRKCKYYNRGLYTVQCGNCSRYYGDMFEEQK